MQSLLVPSPQFSASICQFWISLFNLSKVVDFMSINEVLVIFLNFLHTYEQHTKIQIASCNILVILFHHHCQPWHIMLTNLENKDNLRRECAPTYNKSMSYIFVCCEFYELHWWCNLLCHCGGWAEWKWNKLASLEVRPSYLLTEVKCRATSVAKNC